MTRVARLRLKGSLNLSHFVARQTWPRREVCPSYVSSILMKRGAPHRRLRVYIRQLQLTANSDKLSDATFSLMRIQELGRGELD
jgi:hypothetical protein